MDPSKELSLIYGEPCRVSRIYLCEDGRKRVDLIFATWKRTVQLARAKLEIKLGRRLRSDEEVDHKDGDFTNDRYCNLQPLSKKENASKAARRVDIKTAYCVGCQRKFKPTRHQIGSRAATKAGPFCSRKCSGIYGSQVQNGSSKKKRHSVKVSKYTLNRNGVRRPY